MRRDVMHYFPADVKTVYQAYLTAAQNKPFGRTCDQKPYYSFQFGLGFSMKFNMNGGSCTLHFIPWQGGTAVDLRFSLAQLAGARYEAYDRALTAKAVEILRIPDQSIRINVEEFLDASKWVTPDSVMPPQQPHLVQPQQPVQPPQPEQSPRPVMPTPPVAEKQCGQCGAPLLPDARFCSRCGAPAAAPACKSCGKPLQPGARFCSYCGQKR